MSMRIIPGCAIAQLEAATAADAITALARRLQTEGAVGSGFAAAVLKREERFPTGLPTDPPVAIPHTDAEHAVIDGAAIATLRDAVEFGQMGTGGETIPVRVVLVLALADPQNHLVALQSLMEALQHGEQVKALLEIEDSLELERAAGQLLKRASVADLP